MIDLTNLVTDRIPMWAADMIWPEVANVDQQYAGACSEATRNDSKAAMHSTDHLTVQRDVSDDSRGSQVRMKLEA